MGNELKSRNEVPVELTWDLSLMYKNTEEAWGEAQKALAIADELVEKYKEKLDSPERINACLDAYRDMLAKLICAYNYTNIAASVDFYNSENRDWDGKMSRLYSKIMSKVSFVDSELAKADEQLLEEAIAVAKENKCYLKDILRNKAHMLHPEAERVMAALAPTLGSPYEVYLSVKLADMKFDNFTVDGKSYPLGYSLFEDDYEYDSRTAVRRAAFENFSNKIRQYENVTATAYNACVQQDKINATLRGFENVYDSLLFSQKVPRELYDRQIDLIMEKLAPHMRKYAKLIQKVHGLDRMTYADLKLPLDPDYSPSVTIEEAKEYIKKGLSVMGEEYVQMIEEAFDHRWIDFAQNQGKETGGFCASPYGKNSYILLSWNGRMSDVFTLAHELGHAGHFKSCNSNQSIFDTEVSCYFVEAPSTTNEIIMSNYMLKTSEDKRFRRYVLSNMIANTYYHNFVTHLLEAAYQREVYKIVDAGGSVDAETLSRLMKETLTKFWGDAVELVDGAELTWMRQPHYYMGLYSYTYSAGLTIGTQMCKRLNNEGEKAIEDWKKVLAAGSTLDPVELAAMAGVDITTDAPLLDTIETIGGYIDEICKLTDELQ